MASQGPGLEYQIKVTGAAQGAAEVGKLADASGRVADSTGKAAPQAKSLSEALASLGSRNNPAKDALEGLSTAANGGEGAIFGLTKAFRAFRELLNGGFAALGPGGILVAGLGLVIGLLPKLVEALKPVEKSAEQVAAESKKAADEVKELGAIELTQLAEAFKDIDDRAKEANKDFEASLKLMKRLDDARRESELNDNRNKVGLTDAQRQRNADDINEKYDARGRGYTVQSKQKEVETAAELVRQNQKDDEEATRRFRNSQAEADRLDTQRRKREALQEELKDTSIMGIGNSSEHIAKYGDRSYLSVADELRKTPKVDERDLASANATVEADIKRIDEIRSRGVQLQKQFADATKQLNDEETAQLVEGNSRAHIKKSDNTVALAELKKRKEELQARADAGENTRDDFLALSKEEIRLKNASRSTVQSPSDQAKAKAPGGTQREADKATTSLNNLSKETEEAKVDLKPIADAAAASSTAIAEFSQSSSKSVSDAAAAMTVAQQNIPPALDLSPVVQSFANYNQTNIARHDQSTRAISDLQRQLNNLAQQLANSRSK